MNRLSPMLPCAHVVLDLDVGSKKQIGLLFENSRQIPRARVFDSLFDREKLGSTGLGFGVAIPHGRLRNLKEMVCAFVRTANPVPFESPDGQPVRLVLAMLVPEHATEQHLELLSYLAQMWSAYAPAKRTAAL
jgi:nitrogen PTS system EIIA component